MALFHFKMYMFLGLILYLHIPTMALDYVSYEVFNKNDKIIFDDHHIKIRSVDIAELEGEAPLEPSKKPAKVLPITTTADPSDDYADADITLPPDKPLTAHYNHFYYNSTFYTKKEKWIEYWVDLDAKKKGVLQTVLSNAYRKGITLNLTFDFPFYGHMLKNITVTTGGFLFTGAQVHSWLAATQYIAPLMANFDPSQTNDSVVKYSDNGTALTVQWENVQLRDKKLSGNFTFQVTLLNSGDIIFVYREVPLSVMQISDEEHPVKVGISDAYIIDRTIFFLRRKTIYEYHRVDMRKPEITNTTSIYFTALPTCNSLKDCHSCVNAKINFQCGWCTGRCSDGMDRHRQSWIMDGCGQPDSQPVECPTAEPEAHRTTSEALGTEGTFSLASTLAPTYTTEYPVTGRTSTINPKYQAKADQYTHYSQDKVDYNSLSTAGVVIILFVITVVMAFIGWIVYAYKYPHTPSGQLLIKYRPSQWSWPKGEARYTAASVHM